MPDQRQRRFAVQIHLDKGWETEVYTDWYHQALPIAYKYFGIHKTRIVDLDNNQIRWYRE